MKRTKIKSKKMDTVLKVVKNHIRAHNTRITYLQMMTMTVPQLLANCHPSDRERFARNLLQQGVARTEECETFLSKNYY